MEKLFLKTCFPWGRKNKTRQTAFDFTQHYLTFFHLTPTKLRNSLATMLGKPHYLLPDNDSFSRLRFLEQSLINPVEFVLKQPLIGDAYLVPVHGNLTGYNIILDHHRETWLINFARTGQGVLLQDFASLENFVKFSLPNSISPRLFYEWDQELVNSSTLQPSARLLDLTPPEQFSKAHQVIMSIRRLAHQVSGDDHLREYLIGLLFHTLKLITIMNLKPVQRDLALVSAALICQQLISDSPRSFKDSNKIQTNL